MIESADLIMSLRLWFEWIDAMPTSIALRESTYGYAIVLTAHLVGMAVFGGLILMMDLRLVGWGNLRTPISQLQSRLFPWQMLGMAISTVTGLLLVYSQPFRYYGKVFFWAKMVLMVLAGVNAIAFHLTTYRSVAEWDTARVGPAAARLAGFTSLVLWVSAAVLGRLTAYNWLTYE
jgi:hypothetical protein